MNDDQTMEQAETLPRPRIRFGAIAWGLILIGSAVLTLWTATDSGRREILWTWLTGLTPVTALLLGLLAFGVFVILVSTLGIIRRAQHARR